jgi:hypothetical protein
MHGDSVETSSTGTTSAITIRDSRYSHPPTFTMAASMSAAQRDVHPERFPNGRPIAPRPDREVWINKPVQDDPMAP